MQLKILASAISPSQIIGPLDRVVDGIAYDSRRVQRNFLFVALRGEKSDGHQFIEQAIEKGASVIVTEQEVQQARATCLVVENAPLGIAAAKGAGMSCVALCTTLARDQLGGADVIVPDHAALRAYLEL